ncbi:MAG: TolC family protein [Odoribacter sp.]|nr:TolC family protein [Odoribacter sp.]
MNKISKNNIMRRIGNITKTTFILSFLVLLTLSAKSQSKKWSLQECINYGVEQNLSMQRQLLNNKTDNLNLAESVLDLLPSVSGSTSVGYSFGRSIDPTTNIYNTVRNMSNNYSISGGMNLLNGFRGINNIRYNKVSRLKGLENSEKKANDIAIQIMNAFYEVAYAEGLIDISEEQVKNVGMQLRKMEREYELGLIPRSDLFDMQAQMAESEYRLVANENNRATALINLRQVMNYMDEDLEIDITSIMENLPRIENLDAEEVYMYAKEQLPEVASAELNLKAAQINWQIYKGALFPTLSMSGSWSTGYYDRQDNSFSNQFKNNVGKSFGFSMSIPIFSGLYRQSNVRKAKYNMQDAELILKETEQSVYKEVQLAIQELNASSREFTMALKKENYNTLSYEANRRKYEEGMITIIELNTSDNNLLQAKHDVLKASISYSIQKN